MRPWKREMGGNALFILILACLLLLLPLLKVSSYHLLILNLIGINTMIVVGLNLLIGYAGQISMGHATFFGMGAYCSALATRNFQVLAFHSLWFPNWLIPWIIIFLAMLFTGTLAYLVGIPTVKLKGNYLVMATLGLNIIFEILLVEWDSFTGGSNGIAGVPYLAVGNFPFSSDLRYYYFTWSITLLVLIVSNNLINSRVGRALKAIHGSEMAASTLGIDTSKFKVKVFVLSAMIASFAGSMYAHYVTVITPKSCDVLYSIQLVIMVIVGGMGSIWGSLFGATLVTLLSEVLHVMEKFNVVVLSLILILVMIFFPEGLVPGILNIIRGRRAGVNKQTGSG